MAKIFPSSGMVVFEDNEPYLGSEPQGSLSIDLQGNTLRVYSIGRRTYLTPYLKADEILKEDGTIYATDIRDVRDALNVFFKSSSGGSSVIGEIVAEGSDRSQISIVAGGGLIQNLPPLTQIFEPGKYEIRYNGIFSSNGPNVRGRYFISINTVPVTNETFAIGLSSNLEVNPSANIEVDLSGETTIEFLVGREGNASRTVLLERRYYIIQRIG